MMQPATSVVLEVTAYLLFDADTAWYDCTVYGEAAVHVAGAQSEGLHCDNTRLTILAIVHAIVQRGRRTMHHVSKMIRIHNVDEDAQRRGINIVLIATGLQIIALLLAILLAVAGTISIRSLIFIITSILVQTAVIVLALRGFVDLSGGILVSMAIIGITTSAFFNPNEYAIPIFLLIPILIATAVFRPVGIAVTLIGVFAGMGSILTIPLAEELNTQRTTILVIVGLIALFMAGVGVLISAGNLYLQRRLRIEVKRVEQANASLQILNEELDRRVQMQTAALQQMVEDLEQQTQHQNQLLKEIAEQREVIRELSLPLLPVGRE
ncbi:MAG: hypothetical protein ACUVSW_12445, partial [Roseiflexus sp.]